MMLKQAVLISLIFLQALRLHAQPELFDFIRKHASPAYLEVLKHYQQYEVQMILTTVEKGVPGPSIIFPERKTQPYFYPASLVKLPLAVFALEKMREVGGDPDSRMKFGTVAPCQKIISTDKDAGYPALRHLIRRAMVVSDNESYNLLMDFTGRDYVRNRLAELGLKDAKIWMKFVTCSREAQTHTRPVWIYGAEGQLIWHQPAETFEPAPAEKKLLKGSYHENEAGDIVPGAWDFSQSNRISLLQMQQVMIELFMPGYSGLADNFRLLPEDRMFLQRMLQMTPPAAQQPAYDPDRYPANYAKYLVVGDSSGWWPEGLSIANKVGRAYGYLSDVAYIRDSISDASFFLSAVIYVNENDTINDGIYEYDETGLPFLGETGRLILQWMRRDSD